MNDKSSNPIELPKPGQLILFWDPLTKSRQVAEIKHMAGTVQKRNPGWRNVLVKGELEPRSLNLDLQCDKCIRWKYVEPNDTESEHTLSFDTATSVQARPRFNSTLLPEEQLIENRVYRLPPVNITNSPTFENLKITVTFPEVQQNDDEPSFNRSDPRRAGRLRKRLPGFKDNFIEK